MGIYLDSKDDIDNSKTVILEAMPSLRPLSRDDAATKTPMKGKCFLCLLDNGIFNALGVLFSANERDAFVGIRGRPTQFFEADISDVAPFLPRKVTTGIRFGQ
jgi:hypothetical protein